MVVFFVLFLIFITVPEALCFIFRLSLYNSDSFSVAGDELCISFSCVSKHLALPIEIEHIFPALPEFLYHRLVFCTCVIT